MWRTRSSQTVLVKVASLAAALAVAGSLVLTVGLASAMTDAVVKTQDYQTNDVNGIVDVVFSVEPGTDPILGIQFSLTYDESLVSPVLFDDPALGVIDTPACEALSQNTAVVCGPISPSGQISVSTFRASGMWTTAADAVSIPFVVQGAEGQTELEITGLVVGSTVPINAVAESGSITVGSPTPAATPTATATPVPTPTSLPGGAAVLPDTGSLTAPAAVTLDVLANDSHAGSVATLTVGAASQGTVEVNADFSVTYSPGVSSALTDSFVYTACDQTQCGQTTVTLVITPPTCEGETATIWGTQDADVISGSVGADVIVAFDGADTVAGGAGDDLICAGVGTDSVAGDDGDDRIFGDADRDVLRGGPGDDHIIGSYGNDRLLGGIGEDFLDGGVGDDYLGGFGGDDILEGGPGDDTIYGGFGADQINAGSGDDTVSGLVGNDTIDGGSGADTLKGDRGNDTIDGGPGNDILLGGNADDTLAGGDGDDQLSGGKADDTLAGGSGTDNCTGNAENVSDSADFSCEIILGVP